MTCELQNDSGAATTGDVLQPEPATPPHNPASRSPCVGLRAGPARREPEATGPEHPHETQEEAAIREADDMTNDNALPGLVSDDIGGAGAALNTML